MLHTSKNRGFRAEDAMNRVKSVVPLTCLLLAFLSGPGITAQQPVDTGSICIQTFADQNKNGVLEAGETLLSGVNVSLKQNGILLSNLVISGAAGQEVCFRGWNPGDYTLTVSAPFVQPTTAEQFALSLKAGDRLTVEYGAALLPTPAVSQAGLSIPLTRPVRLGLAIGGALLTMLLMIGLGLVVRNLQVLRTGRPQKSNSFLDSGDTSKYNVR